jgi:regulator of replication initiation timing
MTVEQLFQIIGELFTENRMLRQEMVKLQKEITELKPKEEKKNGK